jgi:hypothetical protein
MKKNKEVIQKINLRNNYKKTFEIKFLILI